MHGNEKPMGTEHKLAQNGTENKKKTRDNLCDEKFPFVLR